MPRDTVCFDLDGTLLDPHGSIRTAIDAVVEWAGYGTFAEDEVLIGMPLRQILRLRTDDEEEIEAMVHRYREVYLQTAWQSARWIPGTLEVVKDLHAAGVRTAIVTTKGEREAVELLGRLDVLRYFDVVIGDDDVRPLKPDPAPVLAACGRLGRRASDACMVGDTVYDIAAGHKAGAYTIGVLWGHGAHADLGAAGADAVVSDAEGLRDAIETWRTM